MEPTKSTSTAAKPANGTTKARKTPERIPRSVEFACQSKVMNLLARLPDDASRRRTMAAVAAMVSKDV